MKMKSLIQSDSQYLLLTDSSAPSIDIGQIRQCFFSLNVDSL